MKARCTVDGKPEGVVEDESEMFIMNRDQKNRNLLTIKKDDLDEAAVFTP